jgi:putative aldouronate transport system permease protein
VKHLLSSELQNWSKSLHRYKYLYLLILPSLAYYIIFHYVPLYGVVLAFKNFRISKGILESPWADPLLRHYSRLFGNPDFWRAVKNTFVISLLKLVFAFPAPIVLSLLLNEVPDRLFRKSVQTIMYLPHFISWVVIGGIMIMMLSRDTGIVNIFLGHLGVAPNQYITDSFFFRPILVVSDIWKNMGWGTIIYLAALSGVDPFMYEAAIIDGAGRLRILWNVTLPQIRSTIAIMLILNLGRIMNAGFEQIFVLYSPPVYDVGDIIDTYVYRIGILDMQYSIGTAAGLFKGIVGCIFIVSANRAIKAMGESGIY